MNELTQSLAIEIDSLHDQANYHAGQAVVYAARCGVKLLEAKQALPHGEFQNWRDANCKVGERHARRYMKLAKEMPELLDDSKRTRVSVFPSIRQAMAILNAPDEIKSK